MNGEKFGEIEAAILRPLAARLTGKWPGLELKEGWGLIVSDQYEECRRHIRGRMRRAGVAEGDLRIDRHKVGAALAWAILRAMPFTYAGRALGGRFATEHLAFYAAIAVVVSFGRTEAARNSDAALMARYQSPFRFPPADDGPYLEHTLKMLHESRADGINPFMLANLLFVLEQYHLAV